MPNTITGTGRDRCQIRSARQFCRRRTRSMQSLPEVTEDPAVSRKYHVDRCRGIRRRVGKS